MKLIDAAAVAAFGPAAAVDAITNALLGGLDPTLDSARVPVDLASGQFLLMPSQTSDAVGIKVATIAPDNPAAGLPRVQAAFVLFDHATLTLQAIIDGTALTTLRTPAVSVAAIRNQLPPKPLRVAIVGAGPQATGHAETFAAVHPVERTDYLVRDPSRTPLPTTRLNSTDAQHILRSADVVVCATSARRPLFDSALIGDHSIVIAVGSHEPDAYETDAALYARSRVVVEDIPTALREAGDVIHAVEVGAIRPEDLITMADVIGTAPALTGPIVFKSVGMAWQDLVVANALHDSGGAG